MAQVAHRYAANAKLTFKWLRDPRFVPDPAAMPSAVPEQGVLPVEIVAEATAPVITAIADNHIAIEMVDQRRLRSRCLGTADPGGGAV